MNKEGKITLPILINIINPGAIVLSSLAPAIFGVILSYEQRGSVPVFLTVITVLIPMFFNASIDLLNDYYDFVRGNDTDENIFGEADAPLAYHHITDPKPILWSGIAFLLAGILLGVYVVWQAGVVPLIIGAIGAVTVLFYSAGKLPLSYLPIGELVSGFVMGGLIPLGVYSALTGTVDFMVLYKSIPLMLIVAQFMLINNTCDIERDQEVGRRTLPIVIGRARARKLAAVITVFWIVQMLHVVIVWYPLGGFLLLPLLLLFGKSFVGICTGQRTRETKVKDVGAVASASLCVAIGLPAACFIHVLLG